MSVERALERMRAPDEHDAERRAWEVVRSAYRERPAPRRAPKARWQLALIPAVLAVIGGLALSPAGARVSQLIRQALGVPHAAPALFSLPAPGNVLVAGRDGTWTHVVPTCTYTETAFSMT